VPRTTAETALKILLELKLVDGDFNFKTDGLTVSVPLIRHPRNGELEALRLKIDGMILEEDEFEPRKRSPRNLEEALVGQIPGESLALLPKSFDIVGDIAILELNPGLGTFEEKVAQAILEVHPNVRSVFARTGPVSGPERIRPLRHVAGENRTETIHREFGCSFKVDLSKAFFSPRLSTEHQQVARQVLEGERVVDMFAGVGPFSILIAKTVKKVAIDAIDSNPSAAKLIQENIRTNKVDSIVHVHLGDAREVARRLKHKATRVIMNHPSAAKNFVDAACTALQAKGGVVHYYTFAEGDNSDIDARDELESALKHVGYSARRFLDVRKVREVAPMKWQVSIDAEVTPVS